uniref:Uncharacterized protein n=1 Tax=Chromera velia CCMP2878 TaxID=1169474 RepID=A0A0G4GK78_9ALVE|eukprot:Cvel_22273.t1-p1 / transcript=Cvel_22273.t1 / gene=Cvel_22273 / organism=Chromera_velia_CCMP2878 / gene_product=WD repeat-containing protein 75, putative / transcript_product=WD repeat-containing protein 75, putative / location=Cvel_scaffold2172:30303-32640(+) / protein_length=649 / sequence_SO=supercontig / SO=protein_coding / is_pseudo=false
MRVDSSSLGRLLVSRAPLFSPDGRLLLCISGSKVEGYSVKTGKKVVDLPHGSAPVSGCAFLDGGGGGDEGASQQMKSLTLVTVSLDNCVRVWSLKSQTCLAERKATLPEGHRLVDILRWPEGGAPDGDRGAGGFLFLLHTVTLGFRDLKGAASSVMKMRLRIKEGQGGGMAVETSLFLMVCGSRIRQVRVCARGAMVAVLCRHDFLVWSLAEGVWRHFTCRPGAPLTTMDIHPQGVYVAVGDRAGVITTWYIQPFLRSRGDGDGEALPSGVTKLPVYRIARGGTLMKRAGAKAEREPEITATGPVPVLRGFEVPCGFLHWHAMAVASTRHAAATDNMSPLSGRLLSGGTEGVIVTWAMGAASQQRHFLPRLGAPIIHLCPSPDGESVAVSLADNSIKLINTGSMDLQHTIRGLSVPLTTEWTEDRKPSVPLPLERWAGDAAAETGGNVGAILEASDYFSSFAFAPPAHLDCAFGSSDVPVLMRLPRSSLKIGKGGVEESKKIARKADANGEAVISEVAASPSEEEGGGDGLMLLAASKRAQMLRLEGGGISATDCGGVALGEGTGSRAYVSKTRFTDISGEWVVERACVGTSRAQGRVLAVVESKKSEAAERLCREVNDVTGGLGREGGSAVVPQRDPQGRHFVLKVRK